tara:strand:+ start:945 stop:1655 length:711 start_codon:yes stop_codon:yes gene_type:complete
MNNIKNILCVVAHPDDEVLGFGATASSLTSTGTSITTLFISSKANKRYLGKSENELVKSAIKTANLLQMNTPLFEDFPNLALHNIDSYLIVEAIENAIKKTCPDLIVTHHPSDLNIDHQVVANLTLAASKLSMRRPDLSLPRLKNIFFMEILSSTDWAYRSNISSFNPNLFFEVSNEDMNKKINALNLYKGVARPRPHPRNMETIFANAKIRGSQCGSMFAEAFESCYSFFERSLN